MLLTKQALKAHVMTSKDEGRPNIGHVKIEPDGRVSATNGHLAVLVTPKGQDRIEEAEFPTIPGLDGEEPTQAIYLPAETARIAASIAPGNDPGKAGSGVRLLMNGRIIIGASDGQTPQLVTIEPPAVDKFPDVTTVIPTKGGAWVELDVDYLLTIARYAKAYGVKGVKLTVRGALSPITVEWKDEYHDVVVALMPRRADEPEPKKKAEESGA